MAELCFCNRPNIFPHHWAINSQARMNLAWSLISSSSEPRPRSKHECSCFTGTSCSMVTRTCFPLLSFSDQKREYRFYDQTVWALLLKGWGGDIAGAMGPPIWGKSLWGWGHEGWEALRPSQCYRYSDLIFIVKMYIMTLQSLWDRTSGSSSLTLSLLERLKADTLLFYSV